MMRLIVIMMRLIVMGLGLVTVVGIAICSYIVISAWCERRMRK